MEFINYTFPKEESFFPFHMLPILTGSSTAGPSVLVPVVFVEVGVTGVKPVNAGVKNQHSLQAHIKQYHDLHR